MREYMQRPEILTYDEIGGFGVPAKAFLDELKALGPVLELTLRINSPGGEVFDGVAIYNALKRHPLKRLGAGSMLLRRRLSLARLSIGRGQARVCGRW